MKKNKGVISLRFIIITLVSILLVLFIIQVLLNMRIFFVNDKYSFNLNVNKKKILICSIETRKLKIVDIHNENVNKYAQKHNYKYIFVNDYKNNLELPVYWWKIQFILDMLNTNNYEYVLWLDSDAFFTDTEIPLESLIDMSPNSSIYIGTDWTVVSGFFKTYCAGVFMVKNDEIGKDFLKDCINAYINEKDCKKDGKYNLSGAWAGKCYEQGVMNKLLNAKYKKNVFTIPYSFALNYSVISGNTVISHVFGDKENTYKQITKFKLKGK